MPQTVDRRPAHAADKNRCEASGFSARNLRDDGSSSRAVWQTGHDAASSWTQTLYSFESHARL